MRCVTGKVRKGDRRERRTGKGQPRGRKSSGFGPELKKTRRGKTPRTSCPPSRRLDPRFGVTARKRDDGGPTTRDHGAGGAARAVRARRSRSDATRVCEWCVHSPRAGHASARATRARRPRATRARTAPRTISSLATASTRGDETRGRGERGGRGRARREAAQRAAFAARPSRRYPKPQLDARAGRAAAPISITRTPARAIWRARNARRVPREKTLAWTLRIQLPGAGGIWGDARRFPRVPRRARTTS